MSLILDALRKSEAERRRGQAPSLYAQAPVPGTALRPAWLPWLPVAGGVLLLVAAAVWFLRAGDAPATKDELVQEGPSLVAAPPAQPAPVVASAPTSPPAPLAAAPTLAPVPKVAAPSVDALVKTPKNPSVAAADAATSPEPQASVTVDAPASSEEAPAEDAVPSVAILDPSTRGALPPMKLSMHVYDTDPARRFAIIDGQRVTEGAQLGSAIVLEIRRDGVLLDVSGRRVLLPRP